MLLHFCVHLISTFDVFCRLCTRDTNFNAACTSNSASSCSWPLVFIYVLTFKGAMGWVDHFRERLMLCFTLHAMQIKSTLKSQVKTKLLANLKTHLEHIWVQQLGGNFQRTSSKPIGCWFKCKVTMDFAADMEADSNANLDADLKLYAHCWTTS